MSAAEEGPQSGPTALRGVLGGAAALCGIHCLLTPVLVLALPALAVGETAEWAVALATVPLGTVLVLTGPPPGRTWILGMLCLGAVLWISSLSGWLEPLPEAVTSATGSLIFASSLLWSAYVCRTGRCWIHSG